MHERRRHLRTCIIYGTITFILLTGLALVIRAIRLQQNLLQHPVVSGQPLFDCALMALPGAIIVGLLFYFFVCPNKEADEE